MNKEDIIRMARNEYGIYAFTADSLAEFVNLVATVEREACAKVCEELVIEVVGNSALAIGQCARSIRARGET